MQDIIKYYKVNDFKVKSFINKLTTFDIGFDIQESDLMFVFCIEDYYHFFGEI